MRVYTVHAPLAGRDGIRPSAETFVFVRDGFHFWAAAASLIWLLYHRLWIATVGYLVVAFGLMTIARLAGGSANTNLLIMALVALFMGFEAASLRRWTLSRGKWRQLDVIVARNRDEAERRFFDRWSGHNDLVADLAGTTRGAPPPLRGPDPPRSSVLGLFPEPGGGR